MERRLQAKRIYRRRKRLREIVFIVKELLGIIRFKVWKRKGH